MIPEKGSYFKANMIPENHLQYSFKCKVRAFQKTESN